MSRAAVSDRRLQPFVLRRNGYKVTVVQVGWRLLRAATQKCR